MKAFTIMGRLLSLSGRVSDSFQALLIIRNCTRVFSQFEVNSGYSEIGETVITSDEDGVHSSYNRKLRGHQTSSRP